MAFTGLCKVWRILLLAILLFQGHNPGDIVSMATVQTLEDGVKERPRSCTTVAQNGAPELLQIIRKQQMSSGACRVALTGKYGRMHMGFPSITSALMSLQRWRVLGLARGDYGEPYRLAIAWARGYLAVRLVALGPQNKP